MTKKTNCHEQHFFHRKPLVPHVFTKETAAFEFKFSPLQHQLLASTSLHLDSHLVEF